MDLQGGFQDLIRVIAVELEDDRPLRFGIGQARPDLL